MVFPLKVYPLLGSKRSAFCCIFTDNYKKCADFLYTVKTQECFYPGHGDSTLLLNGGTILPVCMSPHHRRLSCEPRISHSLAYTNCLRWKVRLAKTDRTNGRPEWTGFSSKRSNRLGITPSLLFNRRRGIISRNKANVLKAYSYSHTFCSVWRLRQKVPRKCLHVTIHPTICTHI